MTRCGMGPKSFTFGYDAPCGLLLIYALWSHLRLSSLLRLGLVAFAFQLVFIELTTKRAKET